MRHRRSSERRPGHRSRDRADVRRHRAPGAGRLGQLRGGGRRPGDAAPQHRGRGRRPSADDQRGRQRPPGLQRRDLQPRGALRAARGRGAPVPHPLRHRGAGPSVRGARRSHGRQAPRDVRLRHLGPARGGGCCSRATTSGRSRSSIPKRGPGSPSPPRSRRCWPTIPAWPSFRPSRSTSISPCDSSRPRTPSSPGSGRCRRRITWCARAGGPGWSATGSWTTGQVD